MPLIEELPTTSATRVSHGWAYVPDTGASISSLQPGSRKRGRDITHPSANTISIKRQKAIQQRLNDLEKENYKDVTIPIPKRDRDKGKKLTQNVRRILQYSRTFQHYLADEEAAMAAAGTSGGGSVTTTGPVISQLPNAATSTPAASGTPPTITTLAQRFDPKKRLSRAGTPRRVSIQQTAATPSKPQSVSALKSKVKRESSSSAVQDTEMTDSPAAAPASTAAPHDRSSSDKDPLLRTRDLPKMPSDRLMQALLAEPPLSWNAARARPLDEAAPSSGFGGTLRRKPPRHFCAICGYWGKIRCRMCGERTCGLMECWKGHEGVCSGTY